MRILLLNPPHPAVSSRCHEGQMPPLGLLAVGGPLLDRGHEVQLLDAELGPLRMEEIVAAATSWAPDAILMGHSGSTSAQPVIVRIARRLRAALPNAWIVHGGVFPTYHAAEVLASHPEIDVIVRGEGEATATLLIEALRSGVPLATIPGIAYRDRGVPQLTPPAAPIRDLDAFRVGWELIRDWDRYQYWGAGRAAVVQFSRGCPHHCSYCGQRGFWTRWRHRDPRSVAAEIGWLHRIHGVGFVDLADENPTSSKPLWRTFLEALAAESVPVQLVGTIRASDIVRDADGHQVWRTDLPARRGPAAVPGDPPLRSAPSSTAFSDDSGPAGVSHSGTYCVGISSSAPRSDEPMRFREASRPLLPQSSSSAIVGRIPAMLTPDRISLAEPVSRSAAAVPPELLRSPLQGPGCPRTPPR